MSNQIVVQQPKNKTQQMFNQLLIISCAILMIVQSVGCATPARLGLGEAVAVGYRDMVWAKRAYNLRFGNCNRAYADHFKSGFCAGYTEMCNGGDGYTPALPPSEYRGYEFQSADGVQCVNSWFEGYPEGVAAAKKDNAGTYHDILISRMINTAVKQDKTKPSLPTDVPIVSAAYQRTGVPIVQPKTRTVLPPVVPPASPGLPPIIQEAVSSPGLPPIIQDTSNSVPGYIPQASNDATGGEKSADVAADYSTSLPLEEETEITLPLASTGTGK